MKIIKRSAPENISILKQQDKFVDITSARLVRTKSYWTDFVLDIQNSMKAVSCNLAQDILHTLNLFIRI